MLKEIIVETKKKEDLLDITREIEEKVKESGVKEGCCVLYVPHTTSGIIINEGADPDVKTDLLNALREMIPKISFSHAEGNSDAHIKSMLVGKEKTLIVKDSKLVLGRWDSIFFAEFDGPRKRKVFLKII